MAVTKETKQTLESVILNTCQLSTSRLFALAKYINTEHFSQIMESQRQKSETHNQIYENVHLPSLLHFIFRFHVVPIENFH